MLKRLLNAISHVIWAAEQWDSVKFSDETKILLFGSHSMKYVKRRIGEDLISNFLIHVIEQSVL